MYYFIPSWYASDESWKMPAREWYRVGKESEFDDTVNHISMFRSENMDVGIISLGYGPQTRYFLHRQGIWPIDYWNAFDYLQNISGDTPCTFSYTDLNWPEDIEWMYTPFIISGYVGGKLYAEVEFGQQGTLLLMNLFSEEKKSETIYLDDRGFMSSSIKWDGNVPVEQCFYNRSGYLQFTIKYPEKSVVVEQKADRKTKRRKYDHIDDLLKEVLEHRMAQLDRKTDFLHIAADERHNRMVMEAAKGYIMVLSFYGERYNIENKEALKKDTSDASFIVTDTEKLASRIREYTNISSRRIMDVSPFDTRLSLGKSGRIRELKVFFPQDGMVEPIRSRGIMQMLSLLQEDPRIVLIVGTKHTSEADIRQLKEEMKEKAASLEGTRIFVDDDADKVVLGENEPEDDEEKRGPQIFIQPYTNETDVMSILTDIRLIVDIRDNPDQYIQIAGISAGIPQINYLTTRYIEDQKNGYMIHNIAHLKEAMSYYLVGLAHWNEALVYCVSQAKKYAAGTLVSHMRERIENGL
jgi:accessory secretory protein Asp1